MARSECFCENFSCESSTRPNERFRFVKEKGVITNRITLDEIEYFSDLTSNDIAHCELKQRVKFRDKEGWHEPKNNYCDKGGHLARSIANDQRSNGHQRHFSKNKKTLNSC